MAAEHERVDVLDRDVELLAMNVGMRAESSTPAMPTTRSRGKPAQTGDRFDMASSGLATGTMMQFGEYLTTCSVTVCMIL